MGLLEKRRINRESNFTSELSKKVISLEECLEREYQAEANGFFVGFILGIIVGIAIALIKISLL